MSSRSAYAHHIRALPPALRGMATLGFSEEACLAGTGITSQDLSSEQAEAQFTLEKEFSFHRRLLQLSDDPLLGLTLGKTYTLETYGLFGYAFLSAATLRQALMVAQNFWLLSYTLSKMQLAVRGNTAAFSFTPTIAVPADLVQYYTDRDAAAVALAGELALGESLPVQRVTLGHDHDQHRLRYETLLGCPVVFGGSITSIEFPASILETPMPMRNAESSSICQQQCQLLLARLSTQSGMIEKVRALIIARPGYFPDIEFVAEKLHTSIRTLRRKLKEENSSYQQILDEVRYQLAKDYLSNSTMPLDEVSVLLDYSTPGNFSVAFKRWHGLSPRQFRQAAALP